MAYQALYRVWRPQTFDQLVGQEMIAETLKNSIAYKQLSHAYLFTGPRGTGKTSTARLLAKTINCLNQIEGNPCNICDSCKAIQMGESPDVIEIDAASNNGVDEIRDLREKVRYVPVNAPYKIYIIDEVHMLTAGAFNALLKTLEEPPNHAIFVLATTEPHKIPATVMSRTQRFDFHKIKEETIIEHLAHILNEMEIKFDQSALRILALAANGGMRDALSLLDQALSYNRNKVSEFSALQVSGSFSHTLFKSYLIGLYEGDGLGTIELIQEASREGKQAGRFVEELIIFVKDILLFQHTKQNHTLLGTEDVEALNRIPKRFYFELIDYLTQTQEKLRLSHQPDLYIQVVTLQLIYLKDGLNEKNGGTDKTRKQDDINRISELEAQLQALSQKLDSILSQNTKEKVGINNIEADRKSYVRSRVYKQNRDQIFAVLDRATRAHLERMKQEWLSILSHLTPKERSKFSETQPLAAGPGLALIAFQNEIFCGMAQEDTALIKKLIQISQEQLEEKIEYTFVLNREWQQLRRDYKLLRDQNGGQPLGLMFRKNEQLEIDDIQNEKELQLDDIEAGREIESQEVEAGLKALGEASIGELEPQSELNLKEGKGEADTLPKHVVAAIELFGKENIEIYD